MKRFLITAIMLCAVNVYATGFDFRTVGTQTATYYDFRIPGGLPSVSLIGHALLLIDPDCNCLKISVNGGNYTGVAGSGGGGSGVSSVFGRVGAVVANYADYLASQVQAVPFATITGTDVQSQLSQINARITSAAITSVFGRTGAVSGANGDYTASNITNVPTGSIAATDAQSAINELATEKVDKTVANTYTAQQTYSTTGLSVLVKPPSAPTANTKVLEARTNLDASNFSIDSEGDELVHDLTVNGALTATSAHMSGTGGGGYTEFPAQTGSPAAPASGFRFFADSSGRLTWEGTNGFLRTFDGAANTAARTYTLPDLSGTVLVANETASGNIGIGVSPATVLHIKGAASVTAPGVSFFTIENGHGFSLDNFGILFSNTGFAGKARINSLLDSGGGTAQIVLYTGAGATEAARFDSSGNATIAGNIKEHGRTTPMGEWIAFTPTVTPTAGTWTSPTYTTARYTLVGKTMTMAIVMSGTTSFASILQITIPGGFTAAASARGVGRTNNATIWQTGILYTSGAGGTTINVAADISTGNFPAAVVTSEFTFTLEIQ